MAYKNKYGIFNMFNVLTSKVKARLFTTIFLVSTFTSAFLSTAATASTTEQELDQFWQALSQSVINGEFEQYKAGYHEDAILVSGFSKNSYSIKQAFARWQQGFADTKNGKMKAHVKFVWTQRFVSENTAHETGMFKYSTTDENGKTEDFIAHTTTLMVKKDGKWLIMMENQKSKATEEEWNAAL
jgi:hypothetical protein